MTEAKSKIKGQFEVSDFDSITYTGGDLRSPRLKLLSSSSIS